MLFQPADRYCHPLSCAANMTENRNDQSGINTLQTQLQQKLNCVRLTNQVFALSLLYLLYKGVFLKPSNMNKTKKKKNKIRYDCILRGVSKDGTDSTGHSPQAGRSEPWGPDRWGAVTPVLSGTAWGPLQVLIQHSTLHNIARTQAMKCFWSKNFSSVLKIASSLCEEDETRAISSRLLRLLLKIWCWSVRFMSATICFSPQSTSEEDSCSRPHHIKYQNALPLSHFVHTF